MREYIFGANILENLTTGMYQDSKVIYREYIQNACDQIDKAYNIGLLKPNEGRIDIWLDAEKRTVSIEDNATGIGAADFERRYYIENRRFCQAVVSLYRRRGLCDFDSPALRRVRGGV